MQKYVLRIAPTGVYSELCPAKWFPEANGALDLSFDSARK